MLNFIFLIVWLYYETLLQEKSTDCFEIEEKTASTSPNRKPVHISEQKTSSLPCPNQNINIDYYDEFQSEIFDSSQVWSLFVRPIHSSSTITLSSLEGRFYIIILFK